MTVRNLQRTESDGNKPEISVADNDLRSLLNKVLVELKLMNKYNAMAHNEELTKEDIE